MQNVLTNLCPYKKKRKMNKRYEDNSQNIVCRGMKNVQCANNYY